MESKDEIYREAAMKLREIRRATDAYNSFASKNTLYIIGIDPTTANELSVAESFVPKHILEELAKS